MGHFSLNGEYTNTLTLYAKRKRVIINRVFSPPNDQNLILQINENNIKREKKLKKDDTFLNYLRQIVTFLQNKKESDKSMEEFIEPFLNCKNTEDISIVQFEELNSDNTKFLNQSKKIKQKLYGYSYARKKENEFSSHTLVDVFLDLFYMHNFTEKGTSVSVDGATQIDCLYYFK